MTGVFFCPNMPLVMLPELMAFYMGKNPQNSTAWDLHSILTAAKSNWKAFCASLGNFPSSYKSTKDNSYEFIVN